MIHFASVNLRLILLAVPAGTYSYLCYLLGKKLICKRIPVSNDGLKKRIKTWCQEKQILPMLNCFVVIKTIWGIQYCRVLNWQGCFTCCIVYSPHAKRQIFDHVRIHFSERGVNWDSCRCRGLSGYFAGSREGFACLRGRSQDGFFHWGTRLNTYEAIWTLEKERWDSFFYLCVCSIWKIEYRTTRVLRWRSELSGECFPIIEVGV